MDTGKRIIGSMEYFDIDNEIQSCIDYVCSSMEETEDTKEYAKRNHNSELYSEINAVWRSQYITLAILKSIKKSNKGMVDEILNLVKNEQEKRASSQAGKQNDDTHNNRMFC
ncbi:hypothetical protein [Staphylococcus xylosus]|uniref:hypothetical protein n=1 Tax=Staphylococcus xylosus TaxID=1288 RepID=UPI002DBE65F8|nr:hypothetical protein [Staphylococcus xylosus]MEB6230010.1 hypothetical protein [Staphylococcus xylosus]